jgi:23S rRNA (adenine2503-C2)-methyltransferase
MAARIDILGLDSESLISEAVRRLGRGSGVAGRVYTRAFASGLLDLRGLGLSASSAAAWEESFEVGSLNVLGTVEEDEGGGTSKALLGLADGLAIECVRIQMPGGPKAKSTLCVSSQVGCRMGCAFCETAVEGFTRNLSAAEIAAQVLTTRIALGWDCGNIVFMGMGECLDNLAEVDRALRVLADPRGLGYAMERITLCSAGPPGGIEALRRLGRKRLNLSISLNAATDEKRGALMPVTRRNGLDALASSLAAYPMRRNFALGVNWCLMPGINDTREDAREAAAFCARVGRCLVNLIPYNPGSRPVTRAPSEEEISRFGSWLVENGCLVKRRATRGDGIMAACGQLRGRSRADAGPV